LEFPYLEPVKDANGKPVIQNDLPVYQYIQNKTSYLHQLIPGFEKAGFKWMSLYDVVPFSPAHRVTLPLGTKASDIMLGDMNGDGHVNVAVRAGNAIEVYEEDFQWPRNHTQRPSTEWLQDHFTADDTMTLADLDGDLMADLVDYNKATGDVRVFHSDGAEFAKARVAGHLPAGYDAMQTLDVNGDKHADVLLRKGTDISLSINKQGTLLPPQHVLTLPSDATLLTGDVNGDKRDDLFYYSPSDHTIYTYRNTGHDSFERVASTTNVPLPKAHAQVVAGDTNGDGLCDVVVYDAANGIWQVMQGGTDATFHPIDNLFGPWARDEGRTAMSADFYGNGKADIASYDQTNHVLDLALSFRK
ncbi:MAG: FG-GAP repeat domain-containing protein, partial [Tumebacillaceae bacterium]